jgi:glycosyltransferase involved in cell wall biosynthesis
MPETCRDAALYFDPENPVEMAERLKTLITDDAVRSSLSEKSRKRAADLPDFEEVTLKTLNIMRALVAKH